MLKQEIKVKHVTRKVFVYCYRWYSKHLDEATFTQSAQTIIRKVVSESVKKL